MTDSEDFEAEFGGQFAAPPEQDLPILVDQGGSSVAISADQALQLTGLPHLTRAVYYGPGGSVVKEPGETLTFPDTAFLLTPPEHRDLEDR